MLENNKSYEYGKPITKEQIEEVLNNIHIHTTDRDFKFTVLFNNQKEADDWMEMFNNSIKEEIKKMKNE